MAEMAQKSNNMKLPYIFSAEHLQERSDKLDAVYYCQRINERLVTIYKHRGDSRYTLYYTEPNSVCQLYHATNQTAQQAHDRLAEIYELLGKKIA